MDYGIGIKYGSVGFRKEPLPSILQQLNKKKTINLDKYYTTCSTDFFWDIDYELEMLTIRISKAKVYSIIQNITRSNIK